MSASRRDSHHTDTFVTYEIWYPDSRVRRVLKTETRKVTLPGEVRGWRVGVFPKGEAGQVHAVKVVYGDPKSSELIEVPSEAVNVQLHVGYLPKSIRESVKRPV